MTDWPPEGHTEPKEYERNERSVFAIMLALTGIFGVTTYQPIATGAETYVVLWVDFAARIGLSALPAIFAGVAIFTGGVLALFRGIVTPIHERIHYEVARRLDLNPNYGHEEMWFHKNPRVVALSTGISVRENMAMLIAPFLVIGVLSGGVLLVSNGLVAGVAGIVLWINSAASAQDVYHYLRLVRMDPETKFANFEIDGEIRTEYAVPEQ